MLCHAIVSSLVPRPLFRIGNYQTVTGGERTGRALALVAAHRYHNRTNHIESVARLLRYDAVPPGLMVADRSRAESAPDAPGETYTGECRSIRESARREPGTAWRESSSDASVVTRNHNRPQVRFSGVISPGRLRTKLHGRSLCEHPLHVQQRPSGVREGVRSQRLRLLAECGYVEMTAVGSRQGRSRENNR